MPRALDGAEMLREAVQNDYAAFVIKDHYFPTMMGAEMIEKHLGGGMCKVYGGIALNNSVGGINLKAVDAACPPCATRRCTRARGWRSPEARG